jgi:hypothetical protein
MKIPTDAELLASIDAFLERHDMAPTRFGRDATGEPQLIQSIREGRSPSLNTLQRIAEFMRAKDAAADQGDASTAAAA